MQLIENLKWRYATKKFDASKKVAQHHIDYIKEAVQLSASSYGLQPYKVLEIKSPEIREQLKPLSWNQTQITEASHLFVFCNTVEVTDKDVDDLMQLKAKTNNIPIENISGYGNFVKGKIKEKSAIEMFYWTAKQTYIALSNAITACATLQIDCTPMEGFDANAINEKLKLKAKGLNATVLLAVGYRHSEDTAQNQKKTRKTIDTIFEELK
ncbi:NAD(P)H-dependent oxidoreductase [Gelatiniphilus marinus]|uniref:NAD(P)H-dependent oxidoreductase n=1 Tax=Gelatiniphilus marinus TaxID=1759464 RepID=A0ABW5JSA0_9FLAO